MSTHDSSGPEPEEGPKPSSEQPPAQPGTPSGQPSDPYASVPPGYGGPYGAPPGGTPNGTPPPGAGGPYAEHGGGPVPGMPPLGAWPNRIAARFIDIVLIEVIAWAVLVPFVNYRTNNAWVGPLWLGYGLYLIYEALMLSRDGQTIGKKLMKVRVAMLADGRVPTPVAAWTRSATFVLPAVICCGALWWPVDGIFGLFDKPYHQCIHDKSAKTVVVSAA